MHRLYCGSVRNDEINLQKTPQHLQQLNILWDSQQTRDVVAAVERVKCGLEILHFDAFDDSNGLFLFFQIFSATSSKAEDTLNECLSSEFLAKSQAKI